MTIELILSILALLLGASLWVKLWSPTKPEPKHEPALEPVNPLDDIQKIREVTTKSILDNSKLFNAIAHQKKILERENRDTIAIFISVSVFEEIIAELLDIDAYTSSADFERDVLALSDSVISIGTPVAYIGKLPVYVSKLLVTAPIYVCGAITWDLQ